MTLWLLNLASSATSRVCLVIGCVVILAARSEWAKRHPGLPQSADSGDFLSLPDSGIWFRH